MFKIEGGSGQFRHYSYNVAYQPDMDAAIAAGLLAQLGLNQISILQRFNTEVFKGNLFEKIFNSVRAKPGLLEEHIQTALKNGTTTIGFNVPLELVNLIENFLIELAKRLADAGTEIGSGLIDGMRGLGMDTVEGVTDQIQGIGKAADGLFDAMTTPAFSEKAGQGWRKVGGGIGQTFKGAMKGSLQAAGDFLLFDGLKVVSGWQTLLGLEAVGRPLTPAEKNVLSPVFGNSVVLDAIRIKEGYAGFLNAGKDNGWTLLNNNRAITIGNTIYMKNSVAGSTTWDSTLVHETTHVWQFQHGGTDYISEALWAQFSAGYGYGEDIFNRKKTWAMLNPEQQGQLIQDAFDNGYFFGGGWSNVKPIYFTSPNQTQSQIPPQFMINYLNQVMPQVRAGQGAT